MRSPAYELGYLSAGLEVFKIFLSSKQLYFPLNTPPPVGERSFPRLTLGGVLLARQSLRGLDLEASQAAEMRAVEQTLDDWRTARRVAWERKAQRELFSRLRQWQLYLGEVRQEPDRHLSFYASEVRIRVMIELLRRDVPTQVEEMLDPLNAMDGMLRMFFKRGDFIWEAELSSGFPPDPYWFLWGSPQIEGGYS